MSRINFAESLDFDSPVTDGGAPKIMLDGGPTYDELTLVTNVAAGEFSIYVDVDNDRRVEITGTEMLAREAYDGRAVTSGTFVFSFADALARTLQGEAMTGLCTRPGQRVVITLKLAASVTEAAPTAKLYVETSPFRPEEFRLYCLPELVPITKTGRNNFEGFRAGSAPNQYKIRRIFAYGAITALDLKIDDRSIYGDGDLPKAVNDARLLRNGKTVPSGCYVYDPIVKGNVIIDLQDTFSVKHFRAMVTTSDSNDVTALTEYVQIIPQRAAA